MTFDELKEKYKDGWWEGHDGYTGDEMCSDIRELLKEVDFLRKENEAISGNYDSLLKTLKRRSKVKQYEDLIGAIANIDGAFITGEGECDYTDKQALDKIMEWVEPVWSEIARRSYKQQQEDTHDDYVSDVMASIRFD